LQRAEARLCTLKKRCSADGAQCGRRKGATLEGAEDKVIGMVCISREDANLLVVSEKGYGKRSDLRLPNHTSGGKGVKTINVTEKTGKLVAIKEVVDKDDLMIINNQASVLELAVEELRVMVEQLKESG